MGERGATLVERREVKFRTLKIWRPPTYTRGRSSSSFRSPLSNSKWRTTIQARQWSLSRPKPSVTFILLEQKRFSNFFLYLCSSCQVTPATTKRSSWLSGTGTLNQDLCQVTIVFFKSSAKIIKIQSRSVCRMPDYRQHLVT